ncbi:MAG: AAA family ATPase [Deltaproteobacteria bacterium]|nr:AAA family ATPase [Deltaproteobacteria bacterium]
MYHSFEVRNFRCFRELTIPDLARVNLIAGVNNVGKTALLESLFLHCGAYNPELAMRLSAFRGFESMKIQLGRWAEAPWDSIFNAFDMSKKVELVGVNESSGRRTLTLRVVRDPEELAKLGQFVEHDPQKIEKGFMSLESTQVLELEYDQEGKRGRYLLILDRQRPRTEPIPPPPPFPAFYLGSRSGLPFEEEAERFGKLQVRGEDEVALEVLQIIEPRLTRLAVVIAMGQPVLHGDIGLGRLIPLPVMGGGMVRLANWVVTIANAQGGVLLVDEIENGLHHSILDKVWLAIGEAARKFNAQVFATTHSLECIMAAHRAFTKSGVYDFHLHRLERVEDSIRTLTYDGETLAAALETGLEVR